MNAGVGKVDCVCGHAVEVVVMRVGVGEFDVVGDGVVVGCVG